MEANGAQGNAALLSHRLTLQVLCRSVAAFHSESKRDAYLPPILDRNADYSEPEVSGLVKFEELCKKELAHHDYLFEADRPIDNLSSNTSFLLAVWKEVLSAPKPVTAINLNVRTITDVAAFKIDVVSANGNCWHKINSIRASRVLAELQESEITSQDQPREQSENRYRHISLVKQCLDMREAARSHSAAMGNDVCLTYRLSRMDEQNEDPRIQAMYEFIKGLDIDLRFGDPEDAPSAAGEPSRVQTVASLDLNLDLSLLIALLSDITHADLPESDEEAEARYQPVPRIWKRATSRTDGHVTEDRPATEGELGTEEHTRALTVQLKQEVRSGLVDELSAAIDTMCEVRRVSPEDVRFWTTREAMERCHDIVRKIAGPREAYRAGHMFSTQDLKGGLSPFWAMSRHQPLSGPLRTFSVGVLESSDIDSVSPPPRSFANRLMATCGRILDSDGSQGMIERKKTTRRTSPPPKVPSPHTTRSMLAGASRGMTTVTANRMSVKQIVRNMGGLQGLEQGKDLAFHVVNPKTLAEAKRADNAMKPSKQGGEEVESLQFAAFMITEPRSLSETFEDQA